jgi:signal transduction histidine kinase
MPHLRRSSLLLALAGVLLAAALTTLALAVLADRRGDRREAEQRLYDRTQITADVTDSLFATIVTQGLADRITRLGGRTVSQGDIDAFNERSQSPYSALVGPGGRVLAASEATPEEALRALRGGAPAVEAVQDGRPYGVSGVIPTADGPTAFLAMPVPAGGTMRVLAQGMAPQALQIFLSSYLEGIPGVANAEAHVVDARGHVLGSAVQGQPFGERPRDGALAAAIRSRAEGGAYTSGGEEHRYAAAPISGTQWRVIVAVDAETLYANTGSTVAWIILAALGLAGLAVLALLQRIGRAARQLTLANDRLVASNAELERSNAELQRSNGELEQFASVASHDLQEPLRKIRAFGDQLERRFADDLGEEGLDHLRRMRGAASRMSTLIDDLLRFSRVTTHARPPEAVALRDVAEEVLGDLQTTIGEARATVNVGPLPVVRADPSQMRQLLQNLIANGVKFHRPGVEPVVEVQPAPGPQPGTVAFTVADNGIGFAPEYRERIFRVFERLHPRDVYAGTGIGLALCRKIVERHGGTITATAEDGAGATFFVVLPAGSPGGGSPADPAPELAHV